MLGERGESLHSLFLTFTFLNTTTKTIANKATATARTRTCTRPTANAFLKSLQSPASMCVRLLMLILLANPIPTHLLVFDATNIHIVVFFSSTLPSLLPT